MESDVTFRQEMMYFLCLFEVLQADKIWYTRKIVMDEKVWNTKNHYSYVKRPIDNDEVEEPK